MTTGSKVKMAIAIVLGALALIIILQNYQEIETRILFWRLTLPHVAILGIVFAAGLILGAAVAVMYCFRQIGKGEKRTGRPGSIE